MWELFNDRYIQQDILENLKQKTRAYHVKEIIVPKLVFLCGSQILTDSGDMPHVEHLTKNMRYCIYKNLIECKTKDADGEEYNIFIPVLSEKLYLGKNQHILDLLTFEEILADISHSIIILLESSGTFCELGAFATHTELAPKLCVVNDSKYRDVTSFITQGPIRKIRELTEEVIFLPQMDELGESIIQDNRVQTYIKGLQASGIKFKPNQNQDVRLRDFIYELLSIIWYFGPVSEDELLLLYKELKDIPRYKLDKKYKQNFKTISDICEFLVNIELLKSKQNTSTLYKLNPEYNYAWYKMLFKVNDYPEAAKIRLKIRSIYDKNAPERTGW